ncbi:sulfite exporter TauE/SafE family protein [Hazenella coriacea]|uniref:Probable membrane transporter protein n=1 Tax=Hazenella coriacea TaxID=1179467 RepID=A0A4R3LB46_9BACL|nr:sulfite exporter TauE/SafE family protein [Hazenella coriacea]TCS96989.1 hypothetical protein EDD58_101636 [Hazenella coriacea]
MLVEGLILLLVGLAAGTIGSLAGLGGGVIIVPALLFLASVNPQFSMITPPIAVGTSMLLIVITALSSTLSYSKQKRVDFRSGIVFFLGCGPGAMVGAYLTRFFQETDVFFATFGFVLILISFMLNVKEKGKPKAIQWDVLRSFQEPSGVTYEYGYHRITAFILSFFIGILSGLFGVGGGSMMMPMMLLLFGFPPHVATATSMFVIFLTAIMGSFTHVIQDNIHWLAAVFLAPGAWLGGRFGAWVSLKMNGRALVIVFRSFLFIIAIRMVLDGLHII